MPLETFDLIKDLDPTWPLGTDNVSQGDDHVRGIKETLQNQFPNLEEAVTATAAELNAGGMPTGALTAFGGAAAPDNWLLCDGAEVSRTTYADLYTVILDTYGPGDGSTTFNLPDMRDSVAGGASATNAAGTKAGKDAITATDLPTMATADAGLHNHDIVLHGSDSAGGFVEDATTLTGPTTNTTSIQNAGTHSHPITNSGSASTDHRQVTLYSNWIIKT